MSMVSEDEANLYENRVYARLLDKLYLFLSLREKELVELQKNIEDALNLKSAEGVYYKLSRFLYQLWGETFEDDDIACTALDKLEQTIKNIREFSDSIQGLRQHGLYEKVTSVESLLPQELVRKLRWIATVRNKVVHEADFDIENPTEFRESCEQVIAQLKTIQSSPVHADVTPFEVADVDVVEESQHIVNTASTASSIQIETKDDFHEALRKSAEPELVNPIVEVDDVFDDLDLDEDELDLPLPSIAPVIPAPIVVTPPYRFLRCRGCFWQ